MNKRNEAEAALKRLKELAQMKDKTEAHNRADGVLCGLLVALGQYDVVTEYEKVTMRLEWGKQNGPG